MNGSPLAGRRFYAVAILLTLLSVPFLAISVSTVKGDLPGPFFVDGYVKDNAGTPMQGVDVVVVSLHGETVVSTVYGVTDEYGFYTVTFPTETVDYGHTIRATATYGASQVSDEVVVPDGEDFGVSIDLQFPFEIPQFGTVLGFLAVAAIVGVIAIVLLTKRSKATKQ